MARVNQNINPYRIEFFLPADMIKLYSGTRCAIWCYREYKKMKDALGFTKPRHIPTLQHFCDYMMLDEDQVREELGWPPIAEKMKRKKTGLP